VSIPVEDTLTYTVSATVSGTASGTVSNTATVAASSNQVDVDPSNNSATDIDSVLGSTVGQLSDTSVASVIQKSGGLVFLARANGRPSVNGTASNSDAGSEIFVWDIGSATLSQITDVAAPLQFDHASRPDLSASADWMTFASTADLPPPANSDGNREIYRYSFPTATLSQLTTTCGPGLITLYNLDGNQELVATDGFGTFVGRETTGCSTRDPTLASQIGNRSMSTMAIAT
jgi:hypothetical protein